MCVEGVRGLAVGERVEHRGRQWSETLGAAGLLCRAGQVGCERPTPPNPPWPRGSGAVRAAAYRRDAPPWRTTSLVNRLCCDWQRPLLRRVPRPANQTGARAVGQEELRARRRRSALPISRTAPAWRRASSDIAGAGRRRVHGRARAPTRSRLERASRKETWSHRSHPSRCPLFDDIAEHGEHEPARSLAVRTARGWIGSEPDDPVHIPRGSALQLAERRVFNPGLLAPSRRRSRTACAPGCEGDQRPRHPVRPGWRARGRRLTQSSLPARGDS